MSKIRILIADDHTIVRQSIIGLIDGHPDFCVVAEVEDGSKIIDKYIKFKPDIVISDISMPRVNGLEAAKSLLARDPEAKIIFLSVHNNDEYIFKSYNAGARGLIGKDILKGELFNAIHIIANGGLYFLGRNENEINNIVCSYANKNISGTGEKIELLSHREKEILECLSLGLTSDEIAEKLILGKRVVDFARASIMEKLGIKNFHNLMRFAVEYYYKRDHNAN